MDDKIESLIREIEASLAPLQQKEELARSLKNKVPNAHIYVALIGADIPEEPFEILPGFMVLRRVVNPPGMVHLFQSASKDQHDYFAIARYTHMISGELAIGMKEPNLDFDMDFLLGMAWHVFALLKLRGQQLLVSPGATSVSWDVVASVKDQSVTFLSLDDVPVQISSEKINALTEADLIWVRDYFEKALEMRDTATSRRFGLAYNISYSWNQTKDLRIALTNLWVGLEALFGNQTDQPVTRRLVERICAWLPGAREEDVRNLYRYRSDCVHGRAINESALINILEQTHKLLRESLQKCIETGQATLPDWS